MQHLLSFFTPRSGSILFAEDLSANDLGNNFEMFYRADSMFLKSELSLISEDISWSGYRDVFKKYARQGIFGTKLNYAATVAVDEYFCINGEIGSGLRRVFGANANVIIFSREDVFAQALSLYVASRTNKWNGEALEDTELTALFSTNESLWNDLTIRLNEICRENILIQHIVRRARFRNVTNITYEEYWQSRKSFLKTIARAIGVELTDPILTDRQRFETPGIESIAAQYRDSFARVDYLKWIREGHSPKLFFGN